jgi:hypothetical protein
MSRERTEEHSRRAARVEYRGCRLQGMSENEALDSALDTYTKHEAERACLHEAIIRANAHVRRAADQIRLQEHPLSAFGVES